MTHIDRKQRRGLLLGKKILDSITRRGETEPTNGCHGQRNRQKRATKLVVRDRGGQANTAAVMAVATSASRYAHPGVFAVRSIPARAAHGLPRGAGENQAIPPAFLPPWLPRLPESSASSCPFGAGDFPALTDMTQRTCRIDTRAGKKFRKHREALVHPTFSRPEPRKYGPGNAKTGTRARRGSP